DQRTFPNRDRSPIRNLARCTAALEPQRDAPIDAVETRSCIGKTSGPIAFAEPASPLAGQSGPARLGCQAFAPLRHPASGFPPVSPVSVRRSRSAIAPERTASAASESRQADRPSSGRRPRYPCFFSLAAMLPSSLLVHIFPP